MANCLAIQLSMCCKSRVSILFILVGNHQVASSRYRVYQYLGELQKSGFHASLYVMPSLHGKAVYSRIKIGVQIFVRALLNRVIFLQKQPLPPVIINMLRALGKIVVFDFDDAIFATHPASSSIGKRKELGAFLSSVDHVIAGNEYLANYARTFNRNVSVIPTCVDVEAIEARSRHLMRFDQDDVIIGWIGHSDNFVYLRQMESVLAELSRLYGEKIRLKVVSNQVYETVSIGVENKRWCLDEEISDVASFDIGIMPLTDDGWSRGKCGFKVLFYMAAGVPVVASPVGVNTEIITDGMNGFLASSEGEWVQKLAALIESCTLRDELASQGRKTVAERFSRTSCARQLTNLLLQLASWQRSNLL